MDLVCGYYSTLEFFSDANHQIFGVRRPSPTFVTKEKKKVHKKPLSVKTYYVGRVQPHSAELFAESREKLLGLAVKDKERMMLEEAKNKVESYIYKIKNMLMDDEEAVAKVSTEKQREEAKKLAEDAEEWLYEDGYAADLPTMEEKYAELSGPFDKILLRMSEATARPKAVEALTKKLTEIEELMTKWEETKPQVTAEERKSVLKMVEEARKWLEDNEKAQAKKEAHEEPVFLSDEVPIQTKSIEALVVRLNRKPKPKVEKKNETATTNATATNSTGNATATNNTFTMNATNATQETQPAEGADANATATEADAEGKADAAAADSKDALADEL
jgi:hypoxia up-regulated 1